MEQLGSRLVTFAAGAGVAVVVLCVGLISWLAGPPDGGGPGIGIGIGVLAFSLLVPVLAACHFHAMTPMIASPSWHCVAVNRNPDGARLAWEGEVPFNCWSFQEPSHVH